MENSIIFFKKPSLDVTVSILIFFILILFLSILGTPQVIKLSQEREYYSVRFQTDLKSIVKMSAPTLPNCMITWLGSLSETI